MFSARQMTYLCYVQWQDDWTASYFRTAVRENHTSPTSDLVKEARLEQAEFDELTTILARADQEDIWHLQRALSELNLINYQIFE